MPTHPLAKVLLCAAALFAGNPGHAESGVDMNVHPGDNFFAYANGAWLATTEIPAGSARWNARNEISELTRRQAELLIAGAAGAPVGTDARKVAHIERLAAV